MDVHAQAGRRVNEVRNGGRHVAAAFESAFGTSPTGVWTAPGRVNLIGDHTDYNDGYALPLGLPQRITVAAAPAAGPASRFRSLQRPGESVSFRSTTVEPGEVSGWYAYPAGVVWALRSAGYGAVELDVLVDGDVPVGAGLSSSAAIECAVGVAAAELLDIDIDATALAVLAQRAENEFVGAPTGVMDQMAAMHATTGHALLVDARTLVVDQVPLDLSRSDLALLVVDTRTTHAHVNGEYGKRRAECEEAARRLGVSALRDVGVDDLDAALAAVGDELLKRRVRHVVTENARTLDAAARLTSGAPTRSLGELMRRSHESLRNDFAVSSPALDLAVVAAVSAGAVGARMTGGGFGGCAVALVERPLVSRTRQALERAFRQAGLPAPICHDVVPSAGAARIL
jgi:galactokinase